MKKSELIQEVSEFRKAQAEKLETVIINAFRIASISDTITTEKLTECAVAIACYYSGSKNSTGITTIVNSLSKINQKLINKLGMFMNKLSSELDSDQRVKRVDADVLTIKKGLLEEIDFKACWRIRKAFKDNEHAAVVRVKTAWAKVEKELDLDALKEQLRQMYRKCHNSKGKNALELALRDLGCTCPEK